MTATASECRVLTMAVKAPIDAHLTEMTGGILPDTKVASGNGWRPVQGLAPGDFVLTFDNGMQPVVDMRHHLVEADPAPRDIAAWPLWVAPGAVGNTAPLILLPGQVILVESDLAEGLFGDPFAAIEARALDGMEGVTRLRPREAFVAVTLHFETDQVVFGAGGVMVVCAGRGDLLADHGAEAVYPVLGRDAARRVLVEGVAPAGTAA